jgi:ATP-dependent DNA helicase RecQ
VAMTRAKSNLNIHLNANCFNHLMAENLEQINDSEFYTAPDKIAVHATFKDIWLDYFINKQALISPLACGDVLRANGDECLNSSGQSVLKFSKSFIEKMEEMKSKHYELKSVHVNFILYWLKEGASQDIKIILPELYFEAIGVEEL